MKCLLVGCGNMGSAMLTRWVASTDINFTVLDPADIIMPDQVVHLRSVSDLDSLFDVIILAVKPQMMASVCPSLVLYKAKGGLVVSIAAGTTLATVKRLMGPGPVVRLMPNLPAKVGLGLSALTTADKLTDEHRNLATSLAEAIGTAMWVDGDGGIDRFTSVAGSGPGYIFELMRGIEAAALDQGFSAAEARQISELLFLGSAALVQQSPDQSLAELRDAVTSKGGTTAAGLAVLMEDDQAVKGLKDAVTAAVRRARELALGR